MLHRDSCLGVTTKGVTQSVAPKVEAPEVLAGHHEAVPGGSPHPITPEAVSSVASPTVPRAGCRVQRFGRLRLDFDALRKRKGSPSCSSDAFRPLKQRKYITIEE